MGLFDKVVNSASGAVGPRSPGNPLSKVAGQVASTITGGRQSISFQALPTTQAAFAALPQAGMTSPYHTAAMYVVALNAYASNKTEAIAMMNFLKGPQPLSPRDLSMLTDSMERDPGKGPLLAQSYFSGATPENDYTPSQPYTVVVSDNTYSFQNQGYAKLFVQCGGADSPRPITLRQAKEGKWFLWEQNMLLSGIKKSASSNPWA